jgi:hypothetical protein
MAMIRAKVRSELPTLLKLDRVDKFLVNKIVASATAFLEARRDPKHPFRGGTYRPIPCQPLECGN